MYSPTSKLKIHPDPAVFSQEARNARDSKADATSAALLEATNRNGLVIFLLVSALSTRTASIA